MCPTSHIDVDYKGKVSNVLLVEYISLPYLERRYTFSDISNPDDHGKSNDGQYTEDRHAPAEHVCPHG